MRYVTETWNKGERYKNITLGRYRSNAELVVQYTMKNMTLCIPMVFYIPSTEIILDTWSCGGLNSGLLTCEASTLPLSYNPFDLEI